MKIKPFGMNILVKPRAKKTVMVSDQGTLTHVGDVIAIGDEVEKIKVGDVIGFTIWGINELEHEDEKAYFIPENSRFILGTLELPE